MNAKSIKEDDFELKFEAEVEGIWKARVEKLAFLYQKILFETVEIIENEHKLFQIFKTHWWKKLF